MKEEWRPCVGFERYEVSNLGQVRNRRTKKLKKCHMVHNRLGVDFITGYETGNSIGTTAYVHILVAQAFLDKKIEGNCLVIHKDGDVLNNCVDNLEYIPYLRYFNNMRMCKKVRCVETGEVYSSIRACSRDMHISCMTISNCAKGKQDCTRKGYHFEFV